MGKRRGTKPSEVNAQRLEVARRRRQRLAITWTLIVVAVLMAAVLIYGLWPRPSPYIGFAKCLTAKGVVMYGTDFCEHCQAQKRAFGTAFKEVAYINCDYSRTCAELGIAGYPTWILANGSRMLGEQPLFELAASTGCGLPK
jgi:hypothetical protein